MVAAGHGFPLHRIALEKWFDVANVERVLFTRDRYRGFQTHGKFSL